MSDSLCNDNLCNDSLCNDRLCKQKRCVNLDWFEVHCFEPSDLALDAVYYRAKGIEVNERAYGTRVYREMFTVLDEKSRPFVEVRRNPFSQGYGGVHDASECHLRLVNAACYCDDAVLRLDEFMRRHGYTFKRIVRVDICLDFERFDTGDIPARFVRRYLGHKFSKINQGNITAHGSDRWAGQEWNSLSWGALKSDIGTKFYNKTMELYDPTTRTYSKPHIRYAWLMCGLVDDFHFVQKKADDGTVYTPDIWRLEFSIRSSVKKWFAIHPDGKEQVYQSIHNTFDMYDNRSKLLTLFASLVPHYFRFKYYEEGKRKDRCKDKELFDFSGQQVTYKVAKEEVHRLVGEGKKLIKPLDSLLYKIKEFKQTHSATQIKEACDVLIRAIEGEVLRSDMSSPWSFVELCALQQALSMKVDGNTTDVAVLMREIKQLLNINNKTAIF